MSPDDPAHAPTAVETQVTMANDDRIDALPALGAAGFQLGELLGRGGMGEVVAARDNRIGREVAVKRMRSEAPSPTAIARFLREARIQGRLDHPAIVPVHELGLDADNRPYFTMKRLAGVTLAARLAEPGVALQPLLRAFVDVCHAIGFAHAREVVHRDLKPSNIMLGDYGEVYVLDWGIARVLGDRRAPTGMGAEIDTLDEGTQVGDLLGTPGYMAPEQARGEPVGTATDVYALGTILFEILAGEPLHPRGAGALGSTLTAPQQAPAERRADRAIAPELDQACHDALADDPAARPTARALGDRVQRYLDGDRDTERRKQLAAEHLQLARGALASGDPEARAAAMRSATRALALDPDSADAAQLVGSLIVEPPRELPQALVEQLGEEDRQEGVARMRIGLLSLLVPFAFLAALPWLHVRSWTQLVVFFAAVAGTVVLNLVVYLRRRTSVVANLVSVLLLSLAFSRIAGPFVIAPVANTGLFVAICPNPWLSARPWLVMGWLGLVTLAPFALEWLGVFGETWRELGDGIASTSALYQLHGTAGVVALIGANLMFVAAVVVFTISTSRKVRAVRRSMSIQAWHLHQMVPYSR